MASYSDGIPLKGNESQPLIANCHIEGTLDDAIHIKMSAGKVEEVASKSKIRAQMDTNNNTNLGIVKKVMVLMQKKIRSYLWR
ncbi:hypothetical protein PI23P_02312 [Polaribacter irgensii 23-P]|uniref:Uncharacterized protein n=1 Tax=Polaribacter irgensii 23-P TaxID=313594 RepID=A4BWE9_9FLAO|nr:hypothetical protein PI23P_02312 [Polaribacter irgensii 23-P]